jgi:hypothetical protein
LQVKKKRRLIRLKRAPPLVVAVGRLRRRDFLRHDSGVQWVEESGPWKQSPPGAWMHHWRTVGPDIPCQVASQQSLTPFLRTGIRYPIRPLSSNSHWTPEYASKIQRTRQVIARRTLQSDDPKRMTQVRSTTESLRPAARALLPKHYFNFSTAPVRTKSLA